MSTDPYLAAEERMPQGWRDEFLCRAGVMFPTLRGAGVADILDILSDSDWKVGSVECWMDNYEAAFAPYTPRSVGVALRAAIVLAMDPRSVVYRLAERKERA